MGDEASVNYAGSQCKNFNKTGVWQWSWRKWDRRCPQCLSSCLQNWFGLFKLPFNCFYEDQLSTLWEWISLWSVRPLCGFPYWILFLWLEVKPFLACCFQECVVCVSVCYTRRFYFTSFEWNGSHPAGLGACINRGHVSLHFISRT